MVFLSLIKLKETGNGVLLDRTAKWRLDEFKSFCEDEPRTGNGLHMKYLL